MRRWLAFGEPVSFTLRIPTVHLLTEERLRERAAAYFDRARPLPDTWAGDEELEEWFAMKRAVRISTLLAERRAVVNALDGKNWWSNTRIRVPRWRWIKRYRTERLICELNSITRWW